MSGFIGNSPVVGFNGLLGFLSLLALHSRLVDEGFVRGLTSCKLRPRVSQVVGSQLPATEGHKVRGDQESDNESRRG